MKPPLGWVGSTLLTVLLLAFIGAIEAEPLRPVISYNKKTDLLSVAATEASYKDTLATIATLSGIEILMDPRAEHRITVTLSGVPLERGLKELSRQSSIIFVYADVQPENSKAKSVANKPLLIGMHVLPEGKSNHDTLQALLAPHGEAFIREKDRYAVPEKEAKMFSYAQQRWEARLKKMPPAQREQLLQDATEKREQAIKHRAEREQRKAEHAKKRQVREQQRQARLEELKATNPELYELKTNQLKDSIAR